MTNITNEETAVALCAIGAEKVVSNELKRLGITVLDITFGRVRFFASLEKLYRALMCLRVADRVLVEMARYPALDFDVLFKNASAAEYEKYVPDKMGVVVGKVRVLKSKLEAETTIQAMVHKAIAARLCRHYGVERLPEGGANANFRVYVEKDVVQILLDISGEPLFKRGYRLEGATAPLRETTAAAILLLSGWRRRFPLYDPFCGSGTLAIEAAMFVWEMAPGMARTFAISQLLIADNKLEKTVRKELIDKVDFSRTVQIYGSDIDSAAIEIAKANVRRAEALSKGLQTPAAIPAKTVTIKVAQSAPIKKKPQVVNFQHHPALRVLPAEMANAPETSEPGFIVTNPPYGRRLEDKDKAEKIYQKMGEVMRRFPLWKFTVITDHPGFESHFGKKADSVRRITNGAVPSYLFIYNNDSPYAYKRAGQEETAEEYD